MISLGRASNADISAFAFPLPLRSGVIGDPGCLKGSGFFRIGEFIFALSRPVVYGGCLWEYGGGGGEKNAVCSGVDQKGRVRGGSNSITW